MLPLWAPMIGGRPIATIRSEPRCPPGPEPRLSRRPRSLTRSVASVPLACRFPHPFPVCRTISMHPYRSHTYGELRETDAGQPVRLSGWVNRKRDHGNLLFDNHRDHHGDPPGGVSVDTD